MVRRRAPRAWICAAALLLFVSSPAAFKLNTIVNASGGNACLLVSASALAPDLRIPKARVTGASQSAYAEAATSSAGSTSRYAVLWQMQRWRTSLRARHQWEHQSPTSCGSNARCDCRVGGSRPKERPEGISRQSPCA